MPRGGTATRPYRRQKPPWPSGLSAVLSAADGADRLRCLLRLHGCSLFEILHRSNCRRGDLGGEDLAAVPEFAMAEIHNHPPPNASFIRRTRRPYHAHRCCSPVLLVITERSLASFSDRWILSLSLFVRRWHRHLLSWPYFALQPLAFRWTLGDLLFPSPPSSSRSLSRRCRSHSFLVPLAGHSILWRALAALAL